MNTLTPINTTVCTIRPDGWVRDHTGAWHEPGQPFPIRTKVSIEWRADWRGLACAVWAWLRGRTVNITFDLTQTVRLGEPSDEPT